MTAHNEVEEMKVLIYNILNPETHTEFNNVSAVNVRTIAAEIATVDISFNNHTSTAKEYDPTQYAVYVVEP